MASAQRQTDTREGKLDSWRVFLERRAHSLTCIQRFSGASTAHGVATRSGATLDSHDTIRLLVIHTWLVLCTSEQARHGSGPRAKGRDRCQHSDDRDAHKHDKSALKRSDEHRGRQSSHTSDSGTLQRAYLCAGGESAQLGQPTLSCAEIESAFLQPKRRRGWYCAHQNKRGMGPGHERKAAIVASTPMTVTPTSTTKAP